MKTEISKQIEIMRIKHILIIILTISSIYHISTHTLTNKIDVGGLLFVLSLVYLALIFVGIILWTTDNWNSNKFLNKKLF